jgi:hypothetical protein
MQTCGAMSVYTLSLGLAAGRPPRIGSVPSQGDHVNLNEDPR